MVQPLQHPLLGSFFVTPPGTWSRRILQARQALLGKTLSPLADNQGGNTDVQENVAIDSVGWVTQYLKGQEAPTLSYVEAGVLCFRDAVFSALPPGEVISLEHEIFPALIACRQLFSFVSDHRFYDIGTPWRLEEFASRQLGSSRERHFESASSEEERTSPPFAGGRKVPSSARRSTSTSI